MFRLVTGYGLAGNRSVAQGKTLLCPLRTIHVSSFIGPQARPTTMTAADFLVYRNTESSPGPPPVRQITFGQSRLDLLHGPFLVGVGKMCYLTPIRTASYPVRVPPYQPLQARLLQCSPCEKPPCGLLMLQGTTPAHRRLPLPSQPIFRLFPSGLWVIFTIRGTHIR